MKSPALVGIALGLLICLSSVGAFALMGFISGALSTTTKSKTPEAKTQVNLPVEQGMTLKCYVEHPAQVE